MTITHNKVLETTKRIIERPQHLFIDSDKVAEVGKQLAQEDLHIPKWDAPVFPELNNRATVAFFLLGNTINFAFTDFDSKVKYSTHFDGTEWKGAFGMFAALKRAIRHGTPLLDGRFLSGISRNEMEKIFRGNIEIPMLDERLAIFREVGRTLVERYGGHFYNVVQEAEGRLFEDKGTGLVQRLTRDFACFDDSVMYQGERVRFDKRAQLASAQLAARFGRGTGLFADIEELTVFADYVLPKALRDMGILVYRESLSKRVDNQELIEAGSQEELEIRAATIHASHMLQERINRHRTENPINALHLDYRLWVESRNGTGSPHHLTKTTAY